MTLYDAIRILGFFVLVASTEMLNGIFRALFLNRRFGAKNAKRMSIVPALLFCFAISYFYVPVLAIESDRGLLLLGLALAAFMLSFDVLLGKFVMKLRWATILDDLDIRQGNLLGVGLIIMALCPWLAGLLRRAMAL